jgi:hypothetical protein
MTYNRPDLLAGAALSNEDQKMLETIQGKHGDRSEKTIAATSAILQGRKFSASERLE